MATKPSVYKVEAIALVIIGLLFSLASSAGAQAIDRGVTMTGPSNASKNPFTYTITLNLASGALQGFALTDTLPGGIHFEIFECPNPPCPPNPLGDIPEISSTPITGTVEIGHTQIANITYQPANPVTLTLTATYTILVRAIPFLSLPAIITSTVALPPDDNLANNWAAVVTRLEQASPNVVPALRDWGMILMICVFGISAVYFLRRKRADDRV